MSRKEVGFLPLTLSLSLQLWKGIRHTHTYWRETWAPDRPQDTLPHGAVPPPTCGPLAHLWPPSLSGLGRIVSLVVPPWIRCDW